MRTLLTSVAASVLIGGTAFAQQLVIVPGPDNGDAQPGKNLEQRYILVPAPQFPPGPDLAGTPDASVAVELYRRGYRQGVADAERAGVARQAVDPAAIERIGRELFERGYVLGMMQAQLEAAQVLAAQQDGGPQQSGQQAAAKQPSQQGTDEQQGQQADAQQSQQSTGQQAATQQGDAQQAGNQQQEPRDTTITTEVSPEYGPHLVDVHGRAVYTFTADKQAEGDASKAVSNCYDACAEAWPPVLTGEMPVEATGTVKAELLGAMEREDGKTQVTYNGWPLYYYVEDQGTGEATGQDIHGFGGEWYLVKPAGEMVQQG